MNFEAIILTIAFFAISVLYMNLNPRAWKENFSSFDFILRQALRLMFGLLVSFIGYYFFLIAINLPNALLYHGFAIALFQIIMQLFARSEKVDISQIIITFACTFFLVGLSVFFGVQGIIVCQATHDYVEPFVTQTDELIIVSTNDMNLITQKTANRDLKLSLANFDNTSRYKTGDLYKQEVNGNKIWVSPVHFSDFFRALGSDKYLPGYVTIDVSTNKQMNIVNDMQMNYGPSALFNNELSRHVHFSYPDVLLYTPSFEIDDTGNTYWVVPYGHYKFLLYFEIVDGVILVNPTTGEMEKYEMDNIPQWVNTVIPADIAELYCNVYGENSQGWISKRFSPSVQFTLTRWIWEGSGDDAWSIIFDENGQMWYTSDTTRYSGNERTMVGYIMISARTGEIRYNPDIKGINGNGICQNFKQPYKEKTGWILAEPTLYSIDNIPTWFSVIVDENGEIQMYCFGTLEGNIATDANFAKALSGYRSLINSQGSTIVDNELLEISGTVFRSNVINDMTYIIVNSNMELVLSVPDYVSELAKMTRDGDFVEIKYSLFEEKEAVASYFNVDMK